MEAVAAPTASQSASSNERPARRAARNPTDQDVTRAHLADRLERHDEIVLVGELLPHEALCLVLVGADGEGLGLGAQAQSGSLGIEHTAHLPPRQFLDRIGIERVVDPTRQRARKDDPLGVGREVNELLEQHLELLGLDVWPPLVDLGVRDSPSMRTKSLRIDSCVSSSITRVPVRPPVSPVATTGTPSTFSARATLMPLPPASVRAWLAR